VMSEHRPGSERVTEELAELWTNATDEMGDAPGRQHHRAVEIVDGLQSAVTPHWLPEDVVRKQIGNVQEVRVDTCRRPPPPPPPAYLSSPACIASRLATCRR
jgi:hypothetical protein